MKPTAADAPLAEKSRAIIKMSRKIITSAALCLMLRAAIEYAKDPAAYEQAMAFDTKKYLFARVTRSINIRSLVFNLLLKELRENFTYHP